MCDKLVQEKVKSLEEKKKYSNARLPSAFSPFPIFVNSLLNLLKDKKNPANPLVRKRLIPSKTEAEKRGRRIHYESRGHSKKLRKKNKKINKKTKHQKC